MGRLNKTTKILLILLGISFLVFAGIHMIEEKEIYELSKAMVEEGDRYYQKKEYKKAKTFYDRALKRYNDLVVLKIIKRSEIKELENKLQTDPILQKVAKGYIYYNGKWVNEKELEALMREKRRLKQKIDVYLKTAKFFGSIEDIENNITIYQNALKEINNSPFKDDKDFYEIKKKLIGKIIFLSEEAAKKYTQKGNLKKAGKYYELVLSYREDPDIKEKLFNIYLQLYNDYLETGDYTKALSSILKAKNLFPERNDILPKIDYVLSKIDFEEIQKEQIHDPYVYYTLAKKSYSRFDIPEAQDFVEKALKLDPQFIPALKLYGRILIDTGEIAKAEKVVNKLLDKAPDDIDVIILAGDLKLKKGDLEGAVSYYEKAESRSEVKDKLFKVYKKLGQAYASKGDIHKAKTYLLKAVNIKDDPVVYKSLGDIFFKSGDYKSAEKYYLQAVKIDKNLKKEVSKKLGQIYLTFAENLKKQKKYKQAITYYKKAVSYLGSRPEIIKNIAFCYEKSGDLKTALSYYKKIKSAKLKEKEAQLYLSLGEKEFRKGSYFSAVKYFKKAVSIDRNLINKVKDKLTTSYIKIGDRYMKQGNYEKSLSYYLKAVDTDKTLQEKLKGKIFTAYLKLGEKAFSSGRYKTAFNYLKKAEKIKKDNKKLVYYLGEIYLKEQNYKKALEYYEYYLNNYGGSPEILKKISLIYAKLGNLKKAKEYAEKLIKAGKFLDVANFITGAYYYHFEKNPDKALRYFLKSENFGYRNGELYYYIGRIYYDKGNYLRSIAYLTEAIKNGYKKEKVYYLRALAYLKLKDYRKAINDLSMVVKYNPDNAKAYYLRGKLYYEHGDYVKGEYKKAIEDLEKAAAMGIKEAVTLLDKVRTKK